MGLCVCADPCNTILWGLSVALDGGMDEAKARQLAAPVQRVALPQVSAEVRAYEHNGPVDGC